MNEEIEKIKDCIDSIYGCDCAYYGVDGIAIATVLYEAGYRKQSEGCDFCKTGEEKCGTCVEFFKGMDGCATECDQEKCIAYKPVRYCPNCGAKMKGGAE